MPYRQPVITLGIRNALLLGMYIVKPCVDPIKVFSNLIDAQEYARTVCALVELL